MMSHRMDHGKTILAGRTACSFEGEISLENMLEALKLVIQIERFEINQLFASVVAASGTEFVRKSRPAVKTPSRDERHRPGQKAVVS